MGKQKTEVAMYMRVGSEAQIGKKLGNINGEILAEEANMKDLAAQFLASSERYNALRATQRTLAAQLFMLKRDKEADKKRG